MAKVLLTGMSFYPQAPQLSNKTLGGSGFIAAHIVDYLLKHG